jgi:hypothetical protein
MEGGERRKIGSVVSWSGMEEEVATDRQVLMKHLERNREAFSAWSMGLIGMIKVMNGNRAQHFGSKNTSASTRS